MPSETTENFIRAAEEDRLTIDQLRHFEFSSSNSACFHAQQYAEKMLKARLIQIGIRPLRSHDLLYLLNELVAATPDLDRNTRLKTDYETARLYCDVLGRYEASSRYPVGGFVHISSEAAEEACDMALQIPYLIGIYSRANRQEHLMQTDTKT